MTDKEQEALRIALVEKHVEAMLDEMRSNGIDALGAAGGVLLAAGPGQSACHVFFVIDGDVVMGDGKPVDSAMFLRDVAETMLRDAQAVASSEGGQAS